jgi:prevent-host-death family protein
MSTGVTSFIELSALEAKMLEYFRRVEESGDELIVTDNGQPVLRILPVRKHVSVADEFADVRGRVVYHEDVLATTTEEWPKTEDGKR